MLMICVFLLFVLLSTSPFSFTYIQKKPLCSVYTTNSILEQKNKYSPNFIGSRKRWATCTGATWFHDDYLAVLNLYGKKITTYKFDAQKVHFELLQEIDNSHGMQLTNSENLVVSPDGSLLAICSDGPKAGIKFYRINRRTHRINPKPIFKQSSKGLIHNVRFTPDGSHLAVTQWDKNETVVVYKIFRNLHQISLKAVYKQVNKDAEMPAKAINFTKDGKFAALVYASKAITSNNSNLVKGLVAIHTFDSQTGELGEQVSSIGGNFCYEDVVLIDNDTALVCSDQYNDMLTVYSLNPVSGQLDNTCTHIHGAEARLDFPHGLALKQDNNYLVVTNYGDDKFNLYELKQNLE